MKRDVIKDKRNEEALQGSESEQRFKDIFNAVNDGIFIIDPNEYCIMEANPKAVQLLGYDREKLIGMNVEKIHPKEMVQLKNTFKKVVLGNPVQTDEFSCLRKDNQRLPADISLSTVRLKGKSYIMAMVRDITERKRAEEEIQNLAKFPSENPNPVLRITKEGKIIYANQGSLPVLTYWDCRINECLPKKWQDHVSKIFDCGRSKELDVRCGDQIFSLLFSPISEMGYLIVYGREVTARVKAEEALQTALDEVQRLKNRLQVENIYLQEEIKLTHNFEEIISVSPVLKKVLRKVEQVATADATVLILGETGTGKELFARAVHNLSNRRNRPLVKVNCAALPANLIESELFGHEKGAFTGALSRRIGRFELGDGGTIFLDEIGDLPLELQAKLLRVLQEGEFERLGNAQSIKVDVRVIAATNRNLENAIKEGKFREDLYYRLNVFPINIAPLRERKVDIPLLVKHFINKYSVKSGKNIEVIAQDVMEALQEYFWPGNVRELENIIERAIIISSGKKLESGDWLPQKTSLSETSKFSTLEELEKNHIIEVLELTGWRIRGERGAATILGLKPTTLEARIRKLGIERRR